MFGKHEEDRKHSTDRRQQVTAEKYPLRAARERAGATLVTVAAAAGVAIATVQRYELDREAVRKSLRPALDAVYARFLGVAA
jgi:hypothetical protein